MNANPNSPIESLNVFSMAETCNAVGQLLGGFIIGRYTDRTRNLRRVFLINLLIVIIGNFLYSVPYCVAFLIVGRFLCGTNESMQTSIGGKEP